MEFVLVPKGKSWLGGGGGKPGDKDIEIFNDFYLGKYEVTQEEWQKIMPNSPSHFSGVGRGKDASSPGGRHSRFRQISLHQRCMGRVQGHTNQAGRARAGGSSCSEQTSISRIQAAGSLGRAALEHAPWQGIRCQLIPPQPR